MDFSELDKWADKNAPKLNKNMLHTFVNELAESDNVTLKPLSMDITTLTTEHSNYDAESNSVIFTAPSGQAYSKVTIILASDGGAE